jgi:lipopolysaccharide export LptBFGC system permease protein LptF
MLILSILFVIALSVYFHRAKNTVGQAILMLVCVIVACVIFAFALGESNTNQSEIKDYNTPAMWR